MPIKYKIDIVEALKECGYNTYKIRKEKLLSEGVLQSLRKGGNISFENLGKICCLLHIQPGDLLEFIDDGSDYELDDESDSKSPEDGS